MKITKTGPRKVRLITHKIIQKKKKKKKKCLRLYGLVKKATEKFEKQISTFEDKNERNL